MNNTDVIVNVNCMDDIKNISKNTKYINLCINSVDSSVIDYFLINGKDYSYSEHINNKCGYIYVDYDIFKKSESIIDDIICCIPDNLNDIEKVRYIYIWLGKIIGSDINLDEDKNDSISFSDISTINNIWGSLYKGKTSSVICAKIFMYILSKININSELILSGINGHIVNKINLEDEDIIVDLFSDLAYIQGGFSTHYFDKYNSDKDIDKKIGYIKEEYMDYYLDNLFNDNKLDNDNILFSVLDSTNKLFNINNIGVVELSKIYKYIFDKYLSSYGIGISNLFINSIDNIKEHFIVFDFDNKYYSYNYNKRCFINVDYDMLLDNFKIDKIGLYSGESFDISKGSVVL